MNSTADQYRIIAKHAGWIERTDRDRLRFDGRDTAAFLQSLLTNDVRSLAPGDGRYAAYLTPQGRMLSDLRLHQLEDAMLAQVGASQASGLAGRFDQLIFTEDVRVADVSASLAQISVMGAEASAALAAAFAGDARESGGLDALPPLGHVSAGGTRIARGDDVELPIFDVFVEAAARDEVVGRLDEAGVVPVEMPLLDALRIEAGRPAWGVDMTEDTIPLEAGLLERAISTTKGCYVGQEIVIRILHRAGGRVARRLTRLRFDAGLDVPPAAGTPLLRDGRDAGRITSAAVSPARGGVVALGYLHRDHAEIGARLTLPPEMGGHTVEAIGFAG